MVAAPLVKDSTHRLAVLGTSVTQNPVLKAYAEKDMGITLDMVTLGGGSAQQRAALSPESYDVYDQWFHDIDLSWPTGSIQPIDINRIKGYQKINLDALTGFSSNKDHIWKTTSPIDRLYVGADLSLSRKPSEQISMMPTIFNADTLAIINGDTQSFPDVNDWSDLLGDDWHGSVVIQKDSAISLVEILLALTQKAALDIGDITDLSIDEIDQFISLFSAYLKKGHFHRHWEVEGDLQRLTHVQKPLLCSMWWSGAMQLRAMGQSVSMITPRGGYRGWFGGLALSRSVSDWALDAAYDYLNWWLTGPAGAYLCRQGGYFTNIEGVRGYLQNHEYEFWIEGKFARYDIFDNDGHLLYQKGNIREGGSLIDRMKSIAIWNTVMPEHNYLVRKWENLPWLKDICD
mgnify:FL=1